MKLHKLSFNIFLFGIILLIATAQGRAQAPNVELSWNENVENDLSHYMVYRDINSGTMVFLTTISKSETDFRDYSVEVGETYYYKISAVDYAGNESYPSDEVSVKVSNVTGVDQPGNATPEQYSLEQNYPNPFNPSTTIQFSMKEAGNLKLAIFDVLGREVRSLINGYSEAGTFNIKWNGQDDLGRGMSSGVYFYQMITGGQRIVKKLILER